MRQTPDSRPYSLLMDRRNGRDIEVHPDLYDALEALVGNGSKCDGKIIISVVCGQINSVELAGPAKLLRQFTGRSLAR